MDKEMNMKQKIRKVFADMVRVERLLLLFFIALSLVVFAEALYGPFLNLYLREMKVELVKIGGFVSIYSLAALLTSIPAGILSDKVGRKIVITVSLVALSVVVFSYSLAHTVEQVYVLRFMHGAVLSFIFPVARAYVMDKTTEENRGRIMGTYIFLTSVASLVAPIVGGVLRDSTGSFNPLFYISAICCLGAAVFYSAAVKDFGTGFKVQKYTFPRRELLRNRVVVVILLMWGMLYLATGVLSPIMSIFAAEELGMSFTMLGWLGTAMGAVYIVSQYFAGTLSDRYGRKNLLIYPLMIYVVGVGVAGLAQEPILFFAMYLLVGIGAAPYATVSYSLIGDVVEPEHRGLASGAISAVSSVGTIFGPLLGSAIGQIYNMRVPFFICAGLVVLTIIMLFLALPQDKRGEVPHEA